ncbi:RNA-binding S4 domain-containing protein [Aliiroseovarius sp. KMU-50]|uniref:RNA-binding S4 domain-containing protein n=1 Tax=Aliiroseovarius salicola TaxID=3009082 RepID=A0ABT4W222_9RHOB|nr:RNA-binding S4 domain-containing protein [Aliiroseovarius sp. KMU-50]MDA5094561.1 RNA-binding S4 domain-containing protein [Aliiroseovarius sp. KMU-50]
MRADKWLWHARFFKTRGLATKQIAAGHVRVNGDKVAKPSHQISPGDVLTFPQGRLVRVIKIIALSTRRGPAHEAQALYDDLSPPPERKEIPPDVVSAPKFDGKGRPSKKDRRNLAKTLRPPLD